MGAPLREVELSEQLNVSRGTMREALRMLQEPGLVELITHRGAFVTSLSPETISEIYTLRALLEPYAVQMALENGAYTKKHLDALEELVGLMGQFKLKGDVFAGSKADVDFHYLICEPSDHQLLLQVLRNLKSLTRLCMLSIELYDSSLPSDELHHRQILEAIQSGGPLRAAEIVRKHINDSRVALLAQIERMPRASFGVSRSTTKSTLNGLSAFALSRDVG